MQLSRDFREFIECCIARDVRFLIVGGYAVAAHGHPRLTKDLDVWIWPEPGNAQRLLDALTDFGFGDLGVSAAQLSEPDVMLQLGRPPQRIDILTSVSGVDFEACHERRVLIDLGGVDAPFLHREDLIVNKRAAGRLQDLADAEALDRLAEPD